MRICNNLVVKTLKINLVTICLNIGNKIISINRTLYLSLQFLVFANVIFLLK